MMNLPVSREVFFRQESVSRVVRLQAYPADDITCVGGEGVVESNDGTSAGVLSQSSFQV